MPETYVQSFACFKSNPDSIGEFIGKAMDEFIRQYNEEYPSNRYEIGVAIDNSGDEKFIATYGSDVKFVVSLFSIVE